MDGEINSLKTEFITIINHRDTTKRIFGVLESRITKLKSIYTDFITSNEKQMFIFGLDSFRFQSKLMDIEFDDMKRMSLAINNRIYCEYYKLYRMIVSYITETINEQTISEKFNLDKFPIYRDLEPFREYDFAIISELHNNILTLLLSVVNYINTKDRELATYNKKLNIGLHIDNFISSFNYDVNNAREKIRLFIKYMNFFHRNHIKMLGRFVNKLQEMYAHIDKDIDFDEEPEFIPLVRGTDNLEKNEENTNNEINDENVVNDISIVVEKDNFVSTNKKRKKKKK
jgi:hypothetical protein